MECQVHRQAELPHQGVKVECHRVPPAVRSAQPELRFRQQPEVQVLPQQMPSLCTGLT